MNKHTPKKKWGQNFLIDSNTINKIVSSINFTKNDRLLEIGPGKGAITKKLGENAKSLSQARLEAQRRDEELRRAELRRLLLALQQRRQGHVREVLRPEARRARRRC